MSVYDYSKVPGGGLIDERSPLETQPALRNEYARAKSQGDAIACEQMRQGVLPMCIVRPGVVYGPGGKAPILSTLLSFGGRVLFLIGGGRRQIPLIYVENLVDALLLMLESEAAVNRIYNLVDGDAPSERFYLRTLLQIKNAKALILPLPRWPFLVAAQLVQIYRDRRGETGAMHLVHGFRRVTGHVRFTASAAQRELGWTSRVAFRDAMWATYGGGEAGAGGVSRNAAIGGVARRDT